jgi:oligopeptidase B
MRLIHKLFGFTVSIITYAFASVALSNESALLKDKPQNTPQSEEAINLSQHLKNIPPKAEKIPHVTEILGQKLEDPYAWLRAKNWPKVEDSKILDYLKAENTYTQSIMKPYQKQQEALYQEMIGRIKLEDSSVPIKKDNYYYYARTEKDSNHSIYCRKKDSLTGPEEIILNANELAKNKNYFRLGGLALSQNHQKLAYSADYNGSERHTIRVKDLKTGKELPDKIENTLGSIVWNKDGSGFFYTLLSDQMRSDKAYFHQLGDEQKKDTLIYQEPDHTFWVDLSQSNSKRFIFINSASKDSTELRYIDLEQPKMEPILIQTRKNDLQYSVDHHGDLFYILSNDTGKNFRIATTPILHPEQRHWKELIAHNPNIYIKSFNVYQDHLAVSTREKGLTKIKIINIQSHKEETIQFPDPSYEASLTPTTFDATGARIIYSSLVTPDSVLEYQFDTKKLNTLKTLEIPSGYNKEDYQSQRVFAISKDGTKIPVSLFYKKSLFKKDGKNPLYLYGYGSYGYAIPPHFKTEALSLVNRGFVYAIAHVRGGDDMGYEWYESAKFLNKWNTFNDFIAVADYLVKNQYTALGNITIAGGSAGGMLIGVVINERPELFKTAIANVPFVDVLNTMLDETLPLTPAEYKEWGNPKDPKYFQYIKSYSPYDNVKRQNYPNLYVSAGLNDPRVTYWEPAKWVAKLRDMKLDNHLLLLDTQMEAGHAGEAGRFGYLKEIAKEQLFILMSYGFLNAS